MTTRTSEAKLAAGLRQRAAMLGFDELRCGPANLGERVGQNYRRALAEGRHATMAWLARDPGRRSQPTSLWPAARSSIVVAQNYGPPSDPLPELEARGAGYVSVYARHRDYHDVLKGRLKELGQWLCSAGGGEIKVFVDTAPLLEKPLAQQAGIGWQGKHTNLLSRRLGSWIFLGEILTSLDLGHDAPEVDHCGQCRRCLDACPTAAFPQPYELDARRCISYLTIEHKGPIDRELRPLMGNRIYGCDDCLAVCPWNKFARVGREVKLQARDDLVRPPLAVLAMLDEAGFRQRFSGSPIKRIGRDRFVRNVLIAIGNSGDPALAPAARALLADQAMVVRGSAVWALSRLLPRDELNRLAAVRSGRERDPEVVTEWSLALDEASHG